MLGLTGTTELEGFFQSSVTTTKVKMFTSISWTEVLEFLSTYFILLVRLTFIFREY